MLNNYNKIAEYTKVFPDFPFYFKYSKIKQNEYQFIYPKYAKDFFQIIALCILEYKKQKEIQKAIYREMYKFVRHVIGIPLEKKKKTEKKYISNPPISKCDLCYKEKKEYLRSSLIPEKKICGACYMKIKRENRKNMEIAILC